jgi:hypothetical protein
MESATLDRPPAAAFELRESISLVEAVSGASIFAEDGTVPVHIIRPGIGKGRGNHLYEADMLAANAHKFMGWRMYVDHESPEARKAAGGLPRSMRDLGGRIVEAEWDPNVPADPARGFGQGAVVGRAKPTRFIRELIEDDPELVEASISASATGVRPVVRDGKRVWLVEGIEDRGSVDWVTEAGAGGRVAALLEAAFVEEGEREVLLESMSDEELSEYLRENRPHLTNPEGGDVSDISPKALEEALASSPEALISALAQSAEVQTFVSTLVEAKLDEERDLMRAEAQAEAQRTLELRDLRDAAHDQIAESKLPESWQDDIREKFTLKENGVPTDDLDVSDEVDDNGDITKPAAKVLAEAIDAEIAKARTKLAEANPTRVRDQGPRGDEDPSQPTSEKTEEKPYWAQVIQEAGIDPDRAYAAE